MSKNPIIAQIGDVIIRKNNFVKLNLSSDEYIKILTVVEDTGLSISKVIALQGRECSHCGNSNIAINVPKNLLSTKKQISGAHAKFFNSLNSPPNDDQQA